MSMEYALYVLIIAVAAGACGLAILAARPLPDRRGRKAQEGGRTAQLTRDDGRRRPDPLSNNLANGATPAVPWGWPAGSRGPRPDSVKSRNAKRASAALQRWADQLIAEKRTIQDPKFQSHREECIKALLEDRFCSPRRGSCPKRTVDSNGGGKGTRAEAAGQRHRESQPGFSLSDPIALSEVRKPWGW